MDHLTILGHIVCVAGIVFLSLSGSIFSIYHYSRKKPLSKASTFIISLAILDMFAMFVAVQIPVFLQYKRLNDIHGITWPIQGLISIGSFVMLSYLFILSSIAVDRVYAVCLPFKYNTSSTFTVGLIIFEIICSSILSVGTRIIEYVFITVDGSIARRILTVVIGLSFFTLLISYCLIICKLRRQQRKLAAYPMTKANTAATVPSISQR